MCCKNNEHKSALISRESPWKRNYESLNGMPMALTQRFYQKATRKIVTKFTQNFLEALAPSNYFTRAQIDRQTCFGFIRKAFVIIEACSLSVLQVWPACRTLHKNTILGSNLSNPKPEFWLEPCSWDQSTTLLEISRRHLTPSPCCSWLLTQFFEFFWQPTEVETWARAIDFHILTRLLVPSLLFLFLDHHSLLLDISLSYLGTSVLINIVKRLRQAIVFINQFRIDCEIVDFHYRRQCIGLRGHQRNRGLSCKFHITLRHSGSCQCWFLSALHVSVLFEFIDIWQTVAFASNLRRASRLTQRYCYCGYWGGFHGTLRKALFRMKFSYGGDFRNTVDAAVVEVFAFLEVFLVVRWFMAVNAEFTAVF